MRRQIAHEERILLVIYSTANISCWYRHSVVTTVRSQVKAEKIKAAFPSYGKNRLDFSIVEDVAQKDAFKDAVRSTPPFEAVIHTASPFHFNAKDIQKVSKCYINCNSSHNI